MKSRLFLTLWVTAALLLVLPGIGFAFTVGNVDGIWGTIDTNGATCDRWATGPAGGSTNYDSPTTTQNEWWNQTPPNDDWNQVRYGITDFSCTYTSFGNQSGFGFDGITGPVNPASDTPFYLGKFGHFNNTISSPSNPFNYVDLTTTVPITCDNGTIRSFEIVDRFTLDETPNNQDPCPYGGDSNGCYDKVTVTRPSPRTFHCSDGTYTVNILGFTTQGLSGQACNQSYNPASVATEFITKEKADNLACLWAEITAPTADVAPVKTCVDFGTQTPYYRIVTTNAGPGSAAGVKIVDTLPSGVVYSSYTSKLTTGSGTVNQGSCSLAGATVTCQLLTTLPATTVDPLAKWTVEIRVTYGTGTWNNSVTASTTTTETNTGNNTSSVTCSPTAVELLSFKAKGERKAVVLKWETATETDNVGFNLYRAGNDRKPGHKVNEELIPTLVPPGSPFGAFYKYRDTTVKPGKEYYYWLEDVDIYGTTTLHGPVGVRTKE